MKRSLFVAVAVLITFGACKSDFGNIPTSVPLAFVTLAQFDAPRAVNSVKPAAYFVDAVNVSIPNSQISADTCQDAPFPGTATPAPLTQIDAGTPVVIASTTDTAQLTPQAPDVNGYVFYKLPAADSLLLLPGSTARITIPGATNAFHPFDVTFVTADSLGLAPIDATSDSTGELAVSWNPQVGPRASVVVQFEFTKSPTGTPNEQIICQFTDNGSHAVEPSLANLWRLGHFKHIHAYRFLTTLGGDGTDQIVILSTYNTDATQIINP